jgi:phage baseplate assembly protein gpV
MMRIFVILVASVAVLGLVNFVQVPTGYAAILEHSYRGHVTSYDQATNTLIVNGKVGDKRFDVSQATVNRVLQSNETVRVKYTEKDGLMVASSVRVLPSDQDLGGGAYNSKY